MSDIEHLVGDATDPQGSGPAIIAHVCNDVGGWGRGFVKALSKRWREPERAYRRWYAGREQNEFGLGAVQFVPVEEDVVVANMVGQHGLRRTKAGPPIRYEALERCLEQVADEARERGATVHMPRIGAGLAGGDWTRIERIVQERLADAGVPVRVYELG